MRKSEALEALANEHGVDLAALKTAIYGNDVGAAREKAKAADRAEALRSIFEDRAAMSAYRLAKWLNANGIASPRGMPWSSKTVLRVRVRLADARGVSEETAP